MAVKITENIRQIKSNQTVIIPEIQVTCNHWPKIHVLTNQHNPPPQHLVFCVVSESNGIVR